MAQRSLMDIGTGKEEHGKAFLGGRKRNALGIGKKLSVLVGKCE
jgi:hypothetical protein